MKNKELGRIIKNSNLKPNFGPISPADLIPATRYKKLYDEFREYDLRRTREVNKIIDESSRLVHKYKQRIKELEEENKKLKEKLSDLEWSIETDLLTPLPEM